MQTLYITERVKHPCEHDNSSDGRTHPKKAQKQGKVNGEEQVAKLSANTAASYLLKFTTCIKLVQAASNFLQSDRKSTTMYLFSSEKEPVC